MSTVLDVHPVAALFPMLAEDAMDELAADIAEHGLAHPIVVQDGVLIDGRNRLEACRRAGVEPRFVDFDGADPVAYILAANVHRRHLSKGQQAMAVAKALLVSNSSQTDAARAARLNRTRVVQAAMVLQWARELADQVLAGGSLDQAYQIAQQRKRALDTARQDAADAAERADRLVDEMARQRHALQLAIESIGPEAPIPLTPDLTVRFDHSEHGTPRIPDPAPSLNVESLQQQKAMLDRLIGIKRTLAELEQDALIPSLEGYWPESHVMAVRSAVSHIVAHAFAVAEHHNVALRSATKLKVVTR